ncbi:unnamed protein product [Acanthoscelides obtectus]|uniref:Uncharacterized protein n=1 Tax=Acanthoscelides obtectus TaxID=200917 RepID=A0A9P0MDA7_ACAOB|nr:unnamed protein product [Acanthoscelides obtectus]CAK1670196.1 hypothetical protein AOBTE_LOCUS27463 [Acanthoscelides obtectus]
MLKNKVVRYEISHLKVIMNMTLVMTFKIT